MSTQEAEEIEHVPHNLEVVRQRLRDACAKAGRSDQPRLVAVSKTKPLAAIRAAYGAGQRHFGENYAQEIVAKAQQLAEEAKAGADAMDDIAWHFIGHLQSNKVRHVVAVPHLFVIETIDSEKLATTVDKEWARHRSLPEGTGAPERINVMVQVNTSGEPQKSGVQPADAPALVRFIRTSCPHLHLLGLMTIGEAALAGGDPVHDYEALRHCRDTLVGDPSLELSMGMSADYEIAAQHGSTNVRVGSSIFGARAYPPKP